MTETDATRTLIAFFEREGYARVEPPVLQPASAFVDLSGEDIRRRMFVTQDASGQELCLRPEYTIPVCLQHLERHGAQPSGYSYGGPVFRMRPGESGEFLQAGIEAIGRLDIAAVDAEVLGLSLEGLSQLGLDDVQVRLGDMGLLNDLIDALGITPAGKRRVIRAIVSGQGLDSLSDGESQNSAEYAGLLAAIEGQAPQAAKAFVEDILSIAGIARVGGRSAGEIAERFLARAGNRSSLSTEARAVLDRYLAVSGNPDEAAAAIRSLAAEAGLDLSGALDSLEERTGFMAARGFDVGTFAFAATFARNLDYYTGFIFEVQDRRRADGKPVVGGGRYDRLLQHLGAREPIPAVGCSFWLDRIVGRP
ncbi:ATP phosphoribosyltransferase regulatory subunit [Microvirga pudoricolor]|uniref:ATP phosphoribosyltransferase regulatory subunit n=1 Tax=Microvirga pudoricolor TaxID=2778729 RepID=UPI00194EDF09|nr:ATP phosphoribosyltransferase regulatory subunit [Microvirga pudoricolor]MBM6592736.1 ATP phosphoribosyltransferase regulatory subunit [Microvirga pudoricolor]